MIRLFKRSLAARFICFTLVILALSQVVAFSISWDQHGQSMRKVVKGEMLSRCAALVRVLEATPPSLQGDILRASATTATRYWISPASPKPPAEWRDTAWTELRRPLPRVHFPGHGGAGEEASQASQLPKEPRAGGSPDWMPLSAEVWPLPNPARFIYVDDASGMGIATQLSDGSWLNAVFVKPGPEGFWTTRSVTFLALAGVFFCVLAVVAAQGITRPLRRLAHAAEALGRGEKIDPLPESGPDDVTAIAFNRMQERLTRFVDDRTRMLAAISHDLRTPLTSLRLRAEFVADDDLRDKMLGTIAEIQGMTEATLAFVRADATAEATRTVELSALVESLCDDLAEIGWDVTFLDSPKVGCRCRPDAVRRACRNLVENAVRYGERARVRVERSGDAALIVVEDDGPGVAEELREQVFAPFVRLEHSRCRETGGHGLGLAIVRTVARRHGGDVTLAGGTSGLRAVFSLPLAGSGPPGEAEPPARRKALAHGLPAAT
ncbi:HAMP domain-containing protein [Xanthobacter autotrophicus]|uniref:ATP-binding protein n=1 Tax=Xanthobacter TaxID=279 RepID=UPI0024AAA99E|nr:ATP-binding protein [Xanthobacter autotrophicus]MDI4664817.1 HAMP domain-containing protein [Xanthobacter autotrophicus]